MSTTVEKSPFEVAVENVKLLKNPPTDDEKLQIYALYKQSTIGDIDIECPSWFNMTARAKYDAWNKHKGVDKEAAKLLYIKLVHELTAKYNI